MATPHTDVEKMIRELNQYILPSTLMECFDAYREEEYKEAIKTIPEATLAWFLDMLNRYRQIRYINDSPSRTLGGLVCRRLFGDTTRINASATSIEYFRVARKYS